ncbi:kelch repeat and BTB domain-containing protein 3 isoform X2 [Lathamus discolor]|uniref:kelch repeat and BTB domain-containing protein 3 isoform X2 n=1 Tax=Lathamus discolor TaxID=678569 RepID=UPI0032B749D7
MDGAGLAAEGRLPMRYQRAPSATANAPGTGVSGERRSLRLGCTRAIVREEPAPEDGRASTRIDGRGNHSERKKRENDTGRSQSAGAAAAEGGPERSVSCRCWLQEQIEETMANQRDYISRPICNGISVPENKINSLVAEGHGQQILKVLQKFREQNIFFDFKILVKDEIIPCHRCVLAACSDFFRAMFEVNMKERDDGNVTISNLSPKAVKAFLDYAYTGKTEITNENVEMLFQLSSFLQVSLLSKACSDFLIKSIDLVNCLQLLSLSESYGSVRLFDHALDFVQHHFSLLLRSSDFLEMNFEILQKCLEADELNVPEEESVLKAVLQWTKHNVETRQKYLPNLIKKVRLHQLPEKTLQDFLHSEEHLLKSANCSVIINDAVKSVQNFSGLFPDARPSTTEKYIFVHKTDEDGENRHTFCYNIKTDKWKELPHTHMIDLPGSSLSSYGEKIFITGGCKGNCYRTVRLHIAEPFHDATDQTWCYCPVSNEFSIVSAMKKPRTMHTSVVTLNQLFVIGGKTRGAQETRSLLDVESYNPLSKDWKSVSQLPRGIYYPEASACQNIIYVLGSEVEITDAFNPSLDCFFKYNAMTDQWSELVAEFGQFFHATLIKAVPVNCTLYICDLSTYKVYSFCPETCVWKGEGSFECAGFNAGAVGTEDKIYILGGDYAPEEITDEVQVYHSSRSEWEEVSPMPRALTEFYCQVIQFNKYRDPWSSVLTICSGEF